MDVLSIVFFAFAVLGAIDYVLGNKFGIGKEFERGFMLLGSMSLSMIGMIVLAPALAEWMTPILRFTADVLHLDPSVIPASLFANDMGGAPLAIQVASTPEMGLFNGLIVAAMMGVIISFTVPFALGVVKKEQHGLLFLGLLCGVVAVPFGCLVSGLTLGLSLGALLLDLLLPFLLAAAIAVGLVLRPALCVKIFRVVGLFIKALVVVGLVLGIAEFVFDITLIESLAPVEEGAMICFNASVTLCGAFPLIAVLSHLLRKPLRALGRHVGINETSALGLVANLASNSTVFGMMHKMDDKGVVLNAAFAASAAFVFGSHLAFTKAIDPSYIGAMILAKIVAGVLSLVLATIVYKRAEKKKT